MIYQSGEIRKIVLDEFNVSQYHDPSQYRVYIFFMVNSGMILFNDTKISQNVLGELMPDLKYEGLHYHQCERAIRYSFRGFKYPSKYYRTISPELRRQVLERDNNECVYCYSVKSLQIDHITPWSWGGRTELYNLQVLCAKCNQIKHNN